MKKILSLLLVFVMCLTLFSCASTPAPTKVADTYLSAIKTNNTEQLSKVYAGDASDLNFKEEYGEMSDEVSEDFLKSFAEKLTSFEYKISNEAIKDDKATVDVAIKTYDLGEAFTSAITEYMQEGFGLALSGASEEELSKMMQDKFTNALDNATFDYESTVKLHLSKTDKGWVVDKIGHNSEFANALTGGIADASKELADAFQDEETE